MPDGAVSQNNQSVHATERMHDIFKILTLLRFTDLQNNQVTYFYIASNVNMYTCSL